MLKSIEFRGKTSEDAVASALSELGLEREDISVEILERGKSGFWGIGAVDAVVRVSYEVPDEEAAPVTEPDPVPEVPEEKTETAEAVERPKKENKKPRQEKSSAKHAPAQTTVTRTAEGAQAEQTEAFLCGLLERMGVSADIDIAPRSGGGLDVKLSGSSIGAVIGRRGETLDAIQHLTNYVVNRGSDKHSHISVDAENYRAKREESLVRLAEKMASKAIKYKRSMALEPMNSYERHIIHAALQDHDNVTTSSTGAEPNRRVVVSYVPKETKKEDANYKEWC